MSRKRRQRSTAIRKRIEKKQREKEKLAKKLAKREGGPEEDIRLETTVPRGAAMACAASIAELRQRLEGGPVRGWTADEIEADRDLSWFERHLTATLDENPGADPLPLEITEAARRHLLDRFSALEMAAPGLDVDWEGGRYVEVSKSLGQAEEPPPPPEEEEEGEEGEASAD